MSANSKRPIERSGFRGDFLKALDERLGFTTLAYKVPKYGNNLSYCLGGITVFGFLILAITGIILSQFYHPHPDNANDSVRYISEELPLGLFVRSIHSWAAQAVLVTILLHLSRVYITAAYKKPREFNWIIGVALLATTIGFIFTGTVLKWDQEAFEALEHNIEMSQLLGIFGVWFSPKFSLSVPLLTRLYAAHVSVLPLLFVILLAAHAFYIRRFGISPFPLEKEGTRSDQELVPFTSHLKKVSLYGIISLAIIAFLSILLPAPLGPAPIEGIEVTKPPWMFLWLFTIENYWGIQWLFAVSIIPFVILLGVPFIDRTPERDPRKRKLMIIGFLVVLSIMVVLTLIAALAPPQPHVSAS